MTTIEPCDFDRISWEELPQAQRLALWMKDHHPAARILDVGCGPGLYVREMRALGLQAWGVDNDPRLPDFTDEGYLWRADVTEAYTKYLSDAPCHFDVIISLEVGEHIPSHLHDAYFQYILTAFGNLDAGTLYFSAARPGQGGHGHISCRPKAYWVEKFFTGFWLDPDATDKWLGFIRSGYHLGWLTQNGMVFKR